MQCNKCGSSLREGEVVCFSCGQEVNTAPNQENQWQQTSQGQHQAQPNQGWGAPNNSSWGQPPHGGHNSNEPPVRPPQWLRALAMALPIMSWVLNVISGMMFMQEIGTTGIRIAIDIMSALVAASGLIIIIMLTRKYQGQKMGCFLAIAIIALLAALGNAVTEFAWQ